MMEKIEELIKEKKYDVLQEYLENEMLKKIINLIKEKKSNIRYTGIFDLERMAKLYLEEKYQYVIKKIYEMQNDTVLLPEERVDVLLNVYKKYLNN